MTVVVVVLCAAGRGNSTTGTGAREAAQRHRTAQRATRVVRGQSTQTSPGGDQRTHRPDRAAQQAPQQVRRHSRRFTHSRADSSRDCQDEITAQLPLLLDELKKTCFVENTARLLRRTAIEYHNRSRVERQNIVAIEHLPSHLV